MHTYQCNIAQGAQKKMFSFYTQRADSANYVGFASKQVFFLPGLLYEEQLY